MEALERCVRESMPHKIEATLGTYLTREEAKTLRYEYFAITRDKKKMIDSCYDHFGPNYRAAQNECWLCSYEE